MIGDKLYELEGQQKETWGWLGGIIEIIDWIGAISAFADAAYYFDIVITTPNMFGMGKVLAKMSKFML